MSKSSDYFKCDRHKAKLHLECRAELPADVYAERNAALAAGQSPIAALLGDPLPGRSALDKKHGVHA